MLSLDTFIILDVDDVKDILKAWQQRKTLDPINFPIGGYPVDANNYPIIGKALLKGKHRLGTEEEIVRELVKEAKALVAVELKEGVEAGEHMEAKTDEVAPSTKEDEAKGSKQNFEFQGEDVSPQ